ncbi:hypothetical protein vBEcoMWL3_gp214 [Escherichia phage vB_EcoM_WL-3]|nr:hypothetical protein vBEcoMWL3_gp214 [Escherichia phage vB_EcoM_WL-3]
MWCDVFPENFFFNYIIFTGITLFALTLHN